MCGILALLSNEPTFDLDRLKVILDLIDKRGPDYNSPVLEHLTASGLWLRLKSSVLHLRGETLQEQPTIDENGNILLFNGQIYQFAGQLIEACKSDTNFLSEILSICKSPMGIVEKFAEVDGPFAFIYWHHRFKRLFYGRDLFGRKSLCMLKHEDCHPVIISSVAANNLEGPLGDWHEVRCDGIYCIDFSNMDEPEELLYPWDLDSIYQRTPRCQTVSDIRLGGDSLRISLIRPLNKDLTRPDGFSEEKKKISVIELEKRFLESVKTRYIYNRNDCLLCRKNPKYSAVTRKIICRDSKVAVAFSGGVDSTLIAIALDKILDIKETIDLVTVAFKDGSPDRDAVGSAFKEIRQLCPSRRWRLILCDISKRELQRERDEQIRDLILPRDTVFDDSIGCASWFVSRAEGRAIESKVDDDWIATHFDNFLKYDPADTYANDQITIKYKSPASMIYVGASIDEQLGGYSSHRKAWSERETAGLCEEVSFLMRRISNRNLGRDDRVYSHHGRDLKLPFLDFQFVSYLNELPMGLKMNLDESLDIGPKKILRELALKWGLCETGRRVKRAMQFGTRIANPRENANDISRGLRPEFYKAILIDLSM